MTSSDKHDRCKDRLNSKTREKKKTKFRKEKLQEGAARDYETRNKNPEGKRKPSVLFSVITLLPLKDHGQ